LRTLLLAGALLSALPLVVEIPLAPRPLPERIFALITLFALCGYWIRGHRRQSFPLWIEPVEALAIYLIASCSKADVLLLPLLGLIFQASYGTLWRSLRLAALYSVALWGASFTGIELTHSEAVSRDVGQFLGVALVRLILHAVQREELGVELLKLYRDVKDHALLMLDPDGRVSTWDDGAEEIYGHPADYAIGRPLDLLFPPIGMLEGGARQELEAAERSGIARTEVLQQRADGSTFQAEITTTALKDGEGRLRGYSRLVQDLTERRRAHEALEESRAQLQAVVGVAPIVLWAVDANGRVVFCEGKQLEQIGVNPRGGGRPRRARAGALADAPRGAPARSGGQARQRHQRGGRPDLRRTVHPALRRAWPRYRRDRRGHRRDRPGAGAPGAGAAAGAAGSGAAPREHRQARRRRGARLQQPAHRGDQLRELPGQAHSRW
jgi:PAS domain S-box-containing protein